MKRRIPTNALVRSSQPAAKVRSGSAGACPSRQTTWAPTLTALTGTRKAGSSPSTWTTQSSLRPTVSATTRHPSTGLCYEIAFTQYAIALADLQLERDAATDASDAMFEVREALSRVWSGAASLYTA